LVLAFGIGIGTFYGVGLDAGKFFTPRSW